MKDDYKTIQIADTVHGIIQLSHLEKEVISTEAFNRLHNILQNSTAYLTYPAIIQKDSNIQLERCI